MKKLLQFTSPGLDGRTFTIRKETSNQPYPYLHKHQEVQITYFIAGSGDLMVNNHLEKFKKNTLFYIASGQPHLFIEDRNPHKEVIEKIELFFKPERILSALSAIVEFKPITAYLQQSTIALKCLSDEQFRLGHIMEEMVSEKDAIKNTLHFIDLLRELSILPQKKYLAENETEFSDSGDEERIKTICNYIRSNFNREISLNEISKIACLTPPAFCRYFKKHTRLTFLEYLNKVRINKACSTYMNEEKMSISEIAYQCGFNSIPNFYRTFKIITGKPPAEFFPKRNSVFSVYES